MDAKGDRIRSEIIGELRVVISILWESAAALRNQKGVGCEFCSDKLDEIAERYNSAISKLNRLT